MKTIAILAPMQEELDALTQLLPPGSPETIRGFEFLRTEFCGYQLVLARSGVGKVNTAMNLTRLLSHIEIDEIVNLGTAGGLREDEQILDLVIPEEVLAVDVDVTPLGFAFGQMLGEPERYLPTTALIERFSKAAQAIPDLPVLHRGAVGSSDAFIHRPEQVAQIRERFGANRVACVEMEGAAVAQVCRNFGISFVIVRSLSDVPAAGVGNHLDFQEFLVRAARNAARLVVGALAQSETVP